jgi:LPS sulfotransferase NodH
VSAARTVPERTLQLRYEQLVTDPIAVARRVADYLDVDPEPLAESLSRAFDRSVGRWTKDLTPEQLADVQSEAGQLLEELAYR